MKNQRLRKIGGVIAWLPSIVYIVFFGLSVATTVIPDSLHAADVGGGGWAPATPDWNKITPAGNPVFVSKVKEGTRGWISILSAVLAAICFLAAGLAKFWPGLTIGRAAGWTVAGLFFAFIWGILTFVFDTAGRTIGTELG